METNGPFVFLPSSFFTYSRDVYKLQRNIRIVFDGRKMISGEQFNNVMRREAEDKIDIPFFNATTGQMIGHEENNTRHVV